MSEEQRINACKTAINQIYTMLRSSPQQWRNFLGLARTTIAHLESTTFMQQPAKTGEQAWMLAALQMLACKDVDGGVVTDIAAWCSRQWLAIVQREPQNLAALRGLGQMWLSRAQPSLARIHSTQGSSSSQRSARTSSGVRESAAEAERRVGTADYVEARGFLQPATEYFERAVAAALTQDALSGELVAKVRRLIVFEKRHKANHVRVGGGSVYVPGQCLQSARQRETFPAGLTVVAESVSSRRVQFAGPSAEVSVSVIKLLFSWPMANNAIDTWKSLEGFTNEHPLATEVAVFSRA